MKMRYLVFTAPLLTAFMCTEQHDPRKNWQSIRQESQLANQPADRLTEDYKLAPKATAAPTSDDPIQAKYNAVCGSCHGTDGQATGPAAAALTPKPRNFADAKWQASVTDERIAKVIREGGTAVGLSASMAAWGSVLTDEEVTGFVALIRGFKQ